MIKDFFISFKENIKDKTTNPFFGTFFVVWSIQHWRFVYSLLTFEEDSTLLERISAIELYFSSETYWSYLFKPILISFIVIIGSYIVLNLSRLIINFFEKQVTPQVYRITDASSIVLMRDFIKLRHEIEVLNEKLEKERELKVKAQQERANYEAKLDERIARDVLSSSQNDRSTSNEPDQRVEKMAKKIIGEGYESDWLDLILTIEKGRLTKYRPATDFFLAQSLVKLGRRNYGEEGDFVLTEFGERVRQAINELRL